MPVTTVVYPGTFDPFTNGHTDIVQRAAALFPRVIVGVAANVRKAPLFSLEQRVALAEQALAGVPGVAVIGFDTLLMDFIHRHGARVIVRGLRALSDFEYEFQMAGMNRRLDATVETLFLPASERDGALSSSFVKEIAALGGDVGAFVHPAVKAALTTALR
ncbi:pantetheine-phosphate adenylyltransferase [Acidiferrobacter sp.]|uniref:pantetheine-phosphate adenylyltransferase n=1 Tax=Acidiferrobacter sp. TaxID=1872107 RepID=UPI00344EDD89